jgi:hypothetical protein
LSNINNSHPINVGGNNKWECGLLNRNWQRDFYWLPPELDNGIFELNRVGVPAVFFLLRAGYEYKELLDNGYTEKELLSAGFTK